MSANHLLTAKKGVLGKFFPEDTNDPKLYNWTKKQPLCTFKPHSKICKI